MSYNFGDKDKEVREFSESMPFGINVVQLMQVEAVTAENGKDYIELTVTSKDGIEDTARCYFVGGAVNISFNTLRQIAVHIAKDEEEKQAARDAVDATNNTEELAAYLNEKCIGGELWFTKYYDATRTYTTENGTFRSINKNVVGYEPKLKPELMPQKAPAGGDANFPGSEAATGDAAANVPKDWA